MAFIKFHTFLWLQQIDHHLSHFFGNKRKWPFKDINEIRKQEGVLLGSKLFDLNVIVLDLHDWCFVSIEIAVIRSRKYRNYLWKLVLRQPVKHAITFLFGLMSSDNAFKASRCEKVSCHLWAKDIRASSFCVDMFEFCSDFPRRFHCWVSPKHIAKAAITRYLLVSINLFDLLKLIYFDVLLRLHSRRFLHVDRGTCCRLWLRLAWPGRDSKRPNRSLDRTYEGILGES